MINDSRAEIRLLRLTEPQQQIKQAKARFKVVACGRRFGKTELAKHEIVQRALAGQYIWYCSPTYDLADKQLDKYIDLFRPLNLGQRDTNRSKRFIKLPTGGYIEFVSLSKGDNKRGDGLDFVVFDEAAFIEPNAWNEVIRPMLATSGGGALFLSTPKGRNWFWEIYQRGKLDRIKDWQSFHFTTLDGGHVPPEELEDIKSSTPERVFREEYLAEFMEDSGSVFRGVDGAIHRETYFPLHPRKYVMGVDLARDMDYTALVVLDVETGHIVEIDYFNEIKYTLQNERIKALADKWNVHSILIEDNVGKMNIEMLQDAGYPASTFTTTSKSKTELIEQLSVAIERGDIGLIFDETLITELKAYELERLPSGRYRYGAPSGQHDDTVIATALAWHESLQHTRHSVRFDAAPSVLSGWRG